MYSVNEWSSKKEVQKCSFSFVIPIKCYSYQNMIGALWICYRPTCSLTIGIGISCWKTHVSRPVRFACLFFFFFYIPILWCIIDIFLTIYWWLQNRCIMVLSLSHRLISTHTAHDGLWLSRCGLCSWPSPRTEATAGSWCVFPGRAWRFNCVLPQEPQPDADK